MQRKFPLQTHLLVINCALLLLLILLMLFLSCSKIDEPPTYGNSLTASTAASINFSIGQYSFYGPFVNTSGNGNILANDAMGDIMQLNFSLPFPPASDTVKCIGTVIYSTSTASWECDNANFTIVFQDSTISGGFFGTNWMLDQTVSSVQYGSGFFSNITLQ
jgi:hypothetical protein